MKINQAAQRTGVSVQNIRFYEKEGLLLPTRDAENGYRRYSEDDLRALLAVKTLRKLDMPLERIRRVLAGEITAQDAAREQGAALEIAAQQVEAARAVCCEMEREAGAVDMVQYLEKIERMERDGAHFTSIAQDFRQIWREQTRKKIQFIPDDIITTPQEFTRELLHYAQSNHQEIAMLHEGMHPVFLLDGVEYSAIRITAYYGPHVVAEMTHPELAEDAAIAPRRRKWLVRVIRVAPIVLAALAILYWIWVMRPV